MPNTSKYKYIYFVEGKCEEKLVNILKQNMKLIQSGKVYCINPIQNEIKMAHLRTIASNTIVVLIFDTDVLKNNSDILARNIKTLNSVSHIKEVIVVPQCNCFEDELVYCTNMKNIKEMFEISSPREFKNKFLSVHEDNIANKLKELDFDINKLWSREPNISTIRINNQSNKIKMK